MNCTKQNTVNFYFMPGLKTNHPRAGIFMKNLLFIVLTTAAITIVMAAIYFGRSFYYKQQYHVPLKSSAAPHKITGITSDDVIDLSGSQASGGGNPMALFDENMDPANGITGDPKTQPAPLAKANIFYPAGRGLRIVIDLHDAYALTDLYLYDRAFEADSVWLYTGEMNNWKLAAAYRTAGTSAAWGWKNFRVTSSSRYVMIRLNSYLAVISEMVLYGNIQQKIAREKLPRLPALPAPTLRAFAGTNIYDNVPTSLMAPFNPIRYYTQMDYFDTDTVNAYPKNKLSLNRWKLPQGDQLRYYADSLHRMGNHLWMSIRGVPTCLQRKGINERDKPVTIPGMNTEDPLSYGRHAKTFWNMAAMFGKTKIDTNLIDVNDVPRFSGLGLMDRFENGNEEDGYWTNYYWLPTDYFAASSADYDGHEGKLGKKHGLHTADSNSKLMMSGMVQLDTSRVKTLYFLCRQLRKDQKFIWEGGVQYHYYCSDATDNLKPPTKGISPEADHLREKLAKVRAFHDRLLPGIPVILGENGYDRDLRSWYSTPLLPGYSAAQSQGIMCIRSLMAAFMAGFDGYNQYMMRTATNFEDAPGPFATSGMIGGPANHIIYPAWYYWSTFIQQLGDYQPDAIISESGPVWMYRLKNRTNPGKKAFVLFSPTTNGSLVKNFSFKPEVNNNQAINIVRLADKNPSGATEKVNITANAVQLDVGESPVIVLEN